MDVTCERCTTEYEFDETLLSGRGTSVKCTNCGHVFKVYPPTAQDADPATSTWRLKLNDGSVDAIDSLRELQRRIASGELTPDEEIARGDEGWKTLGSIPELETFFHAAGFPIQSQRIPSPIPPVMPSPSSRSSSLPPGRRPRQPTLLGVTPAQRRAAERGSAEGLASDGEGAFAAVPEPTPQQEVPEVEEEFIESEDVGAPMTLEGSYRSPYTRDSLAHTAPAEIVDAEFEEAPAPSFAPRGTSTPPPAYYDDDDDIPDLPGRGGSPLRWLVIIVVVGGLALAVSQWDRVAQIVGLGGDPASIAAGIAEGDAALGEAHPAAYANAIESYGRAVAAGGDGDAEVLAKLSNAYALAAQAQLDAGTTGSTVEGLKASALSTAEVAVSLDSRALEGKLALVDAERLAGKEADARERLEDVRAAAFSRTAEFYRVDARLSAAEAEGRLEEGLRSAQQAVKLDPHGARYLLLLARAERSAGNLERAREALDTVLADMPAHPVATELLSGLNAAQETAPEEPSEHEEEQKEETNVADAAVADAAVADAAVAEAPVAAPPSAPDTPPTDAAPVVAKADETVPEERAVEKAAGAAEPDPTPARPTPTRPRYDEYDRLAQAAGSDAFIDGRPPVLDYESNMTKGREELAAGNHARARAYFDSALEVHPGSADAMDALGDVATAVSDYGSALRYYRVAAQRGHPDGYFKLGQTYERLGRGEEAVSAYYTYVKRRPTGEHASEARAAIKTLEPRAKLPPGPDPESRGEPKSGVTAEEQPSHESEPATQ